MRKFSVIIPAYNCAGTIEDTVSSIQSSGLSDFEIVIVDDGSKDGTAGKCDGLSAQFDNISVIHQDNAGVSAARNTGLKAAKGEYIWFFDADDSVDENELRAVEDIIEAELPQVLIFGIKFEYYHNGKLYRSDAVPTPVEGLKSREECSDILFELFSHNCMSAIWNKIVSRRLLEDNCISFREDMFLYEDLEFSLRAIMQCNRVYFYPKAIYRYKQPEDGGGAGRRLMRIPHISELVEKIEEALANEKDGRRILLSLYLTLAREKIGAASESEIGIVCSDFAAWVDEKKLLPEIEGGEYAMLIYNGQVRKIIARRRYTKIRHSVANWIKQNIGDFRKW